MKALVLGGAGFIGSHVADRLTEGGLDVTIFDRQESQYLKPGQNMIKGSVGDLDALKQAVDGQDYVLNFAGIAGLDDAKEHAIMAAEVNIVGNLNVLEAIRRRPPKRFVFASTYYVYSESGSIYRVTKQSCELFIEEYARLYGIPFTIVRYGSVYGPRANRANAIYRFIREAVEFGRITRKGSREDQREYINVLDASAATHKILLDESFQDQHVILAGEQKIKVDDLFTMINEMMGGRLAITYAPGELNNHGHYAITPYSFKPQRAYRYTLNCHHDLGQGMLEMMHEIYEEVSATRDGELAADSIEAPGPRSARRPPSRNNLRQIERT